ncbi:carboxy terminal-processing peptidase [Chromatium okenii]|uniref:carboxy terminal-processing peptidase n=1 Tax=Chromatium okenii TaxID=61644 RepID=UPI0026EC2C32|nr:carboxy terminal-processing peptidase [Chromatium okenii]MBV5307948.1 carboxy terminal-processing peptidase [Chromatium okenii]
MKQSFNRVFFFAALLVATTTSWATPRPVPLSELFPGAGQTKSVVVINKVLERYHYRKVNLDDEFAQQVFEKYLEALDPSRAFFQAHDIERFETGSRRLAEQLRSGDLAIAFDVFRVYRMRVDERVAHALQLLKGQFDFNRTLFYEVDPKHKKWLNSEAELNELWRKRVMNDFLTLRLASKPDAEIRERLQKRYDGLARRIHQFKGDDIFQTFINAYTQTLEPHTSFMSPDTSVNFDISMKLSLEGIGAVLRGDNEYTVVQSTVAGGPARESGQIHSGDQIVGVGQGLDGAMEDVVGWRLEDVVDKIRGPKGSVVRLQLLSKAPGTSNRTREITLVRNEIKLEDQAAKSFVVDQLANAPDTKIGVIEIPAFYRDFEGENAGNQNFRSTTRDVRQLIMELRAQGVSGIVIDLRGNGGGSLAEATSLTGLFIDTGPVVQVKDAFGKIEVEADTDPGAAYTGPLAVVVDRDSASASEIFAAAIQDHGRGLIIGEPTFGKGTVQTLIDLNRYVPGEHGDLGRLRLTMAEFFRINGGSTQLHGVTPDIEFPSASNLNEHGERSLDHALPWTQIKPADYHASKLTNLDQLRRQSAARIAQDSGFKMLTERSKMLHDIDTETEVSLRESQRRAENQQREQAFKTDRERYLRVRGITPVDENAEQIDEDALEVERKAIARIEIEEAARIVIDSILLERGAPAPQQAVMR